MSGCTWRSVLCHAESINFFSLLYSETALKSLCCSLEECSFEHCKNRKTKALLQELRPTAPIVFLCLNSFIDLTPTQLIQDMVTTEGNKRRLTLRHQNEWVVQLCRGDYSKQHNYLYMPSHPKGRAAKSKWSFCRCEETFCLWSILRQHATPGSKTTCQERIDRGICGSALQWWNSTPASFCSKSENKTSMSGIKKTKHATKSTFAPKGFLSSKEPSWHELSQGTTLHSRGALASCCCGGNPDPES